jgi:PHD/YefM family antitoxin component YafN of YafNO toxin-antitoxin module
VVSIHPQFVVDEDKNTKAVLVSLPEWQQIMEALEELDDIRAYDLAKSEPADMIDFDQAVDNLEDGTSD